MKIVILSSAAVLAALYMAVPASAASVSCSIPNAVSCTVTSSKGLQRVWAVSTSGYGVITSKTFHNCPKSVTIGWDSNYQANVQYRECSVARGFTLKPSGGGNGGAALRLSQ